jgi:hypothetical protein
VLPVIGISRKALKEKITVGNDPEPMSVLNVLNRQPTPQSDTIGKYFFLTTNDQFTQAKEFITNTLPQLWAKFDNTFLHELPASVQVPRLTTSNLKDASTVRTAKLLSYVAVDIPDNAAANSKWAKPP